MLEKIYHRHHMTHHIIDEYPTTCLVWREASGSLKVGVDYGQSDYLGAWVEMRASLYINRMCTLFLSRQLHANR